MMRSIGYKVTQQVSHRLIKCQSRLWSQRGAKVNRSHHGDNPLLRPTGIQIATIGYATLQAMAPTNVKTVHHISLLHTESNLDRLGFLSPIHGQHSQQQSGQITLEPVLINKPKFLKVTNRTGLELVKPAREPASSRPKPYASMKTPHESCLFAAPCWLSQEEKIPRSDISFSLRNLPVRAFDSRAQGLITPLAGRRSSYPPLSPNLVRTHAIER